MVNLLVRIFVIVFVSLLMAGTGNAQEPATVPQPIPGSVQPLNTPDISWSATTNLLAYVPVQPVEDMVPNAQTSTGGYIALWQPELNPLVDTMTLDSTRVERLPVMNGSPQSTDSPQVQAALPHSPTFNPTGTLLATRGNTGLVMYDVQSEIPLFSSQEIFGGVWSPDGTRLISQNVEGAAYTAEVWDARTGDLLASYPLFPTPSDLRFEQIAFSWSTPNEVAMSGISGGSIRAILDLSTGQVRDIVNCCPTRAPRLLWQPGGRLLAMHDAIYDLDTQSVLFTFPSQADIYWSPDGQLLIGTFLEQVSIISVAERRIIAQFTTAALGEGHVVSDVEWSPNGQYLALATSSGIVNVEYYLSLWSLEALRLPVSTN
jgi:WD40 repeat protein